jgi:3-dehydroquinate dehydratase type I
MICIPIVARNTEQALEKMGRAATMADMLEIRLDLMETFDLQEILQASRKPVLVTYRSEREGGKGGAAPEVQTDYLQTAVEKGANLVDVELSLHPKWRQKIFDAGGKSGIVISTHINDGTPSGQDLEKIFRDSVATGADIVKVVTRAESWADNLRVLELIPRGREQDIKVIAFCMGPKGRISRVFSLLLGGYLTFASLETGQESATGQIPVIEMKKMLEHCSV